MSIEQMRQALLKSYSGRRWQEKVKKMPDNQVIATYYRLKSVGQV